MAKRTILLLLLLALLMGLVPPLTAAAESTGEMDCSISVPAARWEAAKNLRDDDYRTRYTLTSGQSLTIHWKGEAGGVLLHWFDEKQWYSRDYVATIRLYDEGGKLLSENVYQKMNYRMFVPVKGAARMEVQCTERFSPMISLCEVKVFAPGYEPANLPKQHRVDLMLVLSSVSEELDMMGGLLPLYAGEYALRTAVVYVGRDDGAQVQECFKALEEMGLDVIPLFLQQEDHMTYNKDKLPMLWKEVQLKESLAQLFAAYQPKVVVTCDPEDTDSLPRTPYTGKLVRDVITKWNDSRKMGVQKLYLRSKKGWTTLDGTRPLSVYEGRSAVDVARTAYAQYRSEASYHTTIPESPRFQLVYTKVGEDEKQNDLLEHISPKAFLSYREPVIVDPAPAAEVEAPPPDPNDIYFRQEGDPAEVVIQDYEKGHWEYRSDILSVIIDKVTTREKNNHPYCKYIAHVRMRRVNSFRSIVAARQEKAVANETPWRISRNQRAVLAVTGDNINNADVSAKGILIRSGVLYSDRTGDSTMVIGDDMTMRIYHPKEVSGLDLLDSGVLDAFSFGPVLVENGKVNPKADKHRVFKENPRCGVGMVEPGHFVVIVSDGRDSHRAYGYTLGEFAQVFVDQGAQVAYNLDGGSSTAMVFMGEHVNWHSVGNQRTWADGLVWGYSELVPKVSDPVNHPGYGSRP